MIECLNQKYSRARVFGISSIGMLIIFPSEFRTIKSHYNPDTQELIIIVDVRNAHLFFDTKAIDMFEAVKEPLKRQPTLDHWIEDVRYSI